MNTTELKKIIKNELNSLEPCEEGLEEFETKDLKDISNDSKVWFASMNVRTCKIALESGLFDVNMKDNDGKTALMYAVDRGDYNTVKLLLDNGADVNMKYNYGRTALMYAVDRGDYNTIKLLLDNGADVNMQNKYGRTALMYAVGREDYNTVKLLLDNGADVNMKNNDGDTALDYAKEYERTEIIELLNKYTNK